jgi:uncharacterized membrane protein
MYRKKLFSLQGCVLRKLVAMFLLISTMFVLTFFFNGGAAFAQGNIILSTAFPGVTVKPGETAEFSVDVRNNSLQPQIVGLSIKSIPSGWEGFFEGGSKTIHKAYVNKQDSVFVDFKVKIPSEVPEGNYKIILKAEAPGGSDELTLDLKVSEVARSESKLTAQYPELQGPSGAVYKFRVDLANNSSKEQSYSLGAKVPSGWQVSFTPAYGDKQIASLSLEPGKSQGLDVEVKPPQTVKAGKYSIPIAITSVDEFITTELHVIITGNYEISLTTPTGRLNAEAYAGKETTITLKVSNEGSADLKNISFTSAEPSNWSVTFEPEKLDVLQAGQSQEIKARIKPAPKAIAGDYVVRMSASTPETLSSAEFRVTVKTPTAWGIVGIVIILLLIGGLTWTFKTYGRR